MKVIVSNGRWRRWIFESSDRARAIRFAWRFGLSVETVSEVPFAPAYTVWVGVEDRAFSEPLMEVQERPYDIKLLGI